MTEMIERVARAIRDSELGYGLRLTRLVDDEATYVLSIHGEEPREFSNINDAHEFVRIRQDELRAVAAISAMREPTEGMVEAAYVYGFGDTWGVNRQELRDSWRLLIDSALATEEGGE